jgi:hypothetical protein
VSKASHHILQPDLQFDIEIAVLGFIHTAAAAQAYSQHS